LRPLANLDFYDNTGTLAGQEDGSIADNQKANAKVSVTQNTKTQQYAETINQPVTGWPRPDLREVWKARAVLYQLSVRQIKIRYKQTIMGLGWAIISPLITMVVFSFVFGRLAQVSSYDIPYPIFSYTALVPWTLFAKGLHTASISVVASSNLITKVYVPRLTAPISQLFTGLVDFVLAFAILLIMMAGYGYAPTINVIWLPFLILLSLAAALAVGLWFSALHVLFRDIGQLIPFIVQMWLYLTPVAYPSDLLHGTERVLYGLNPMVTVCDGFRWALLGANAFDTTTAAVSVITTIILLITGTFFFRRMESSFPDFI
jgi:lipopolysaccharide transport system permease protein